MKIDNRYTLTLITTTGELVPIGAGGLMPKFHVFNDWTRAHGAIADAIATIGIDNVLTIAQTSVRRQGERVEFNVTHLERGHIVELCASFKSNDHRTKRRDGRSGRVTIPVDDYGDPSPSDGQL